MKINMSSLVKTLLVPSFICLSSPFTTLAEVSVSLSNGQSIYVPAYSHVFSGDRPVQFNVAVMLSIRNTDLNQSIKITSVEYFDNAGKLIRKYVAAPMVLGPLASHEFFVKENDESGGFGANFLVRWESSKEVNVPIVESIMIGTKSGQGISFISPGRPIREERKTAAP